METVERNRGKVTIIPDSEEAGKKLKSFSGIAALLRYSSKN
jgi:stalled ribosome rescue protein Dom34